jgi:hypothetical protein
MTNIIPPKVRLLGYAQARVGFANHPLRAHEIPVEHEVSLPLPTLRFNEPGYAWFAGPARYRPGQPARLGLPDRWWVFGAARRGLITYARTRAIPFSTGPLGPPAVELPPVTRDLDAIEEDMRLLDSLADRAAPEFFAGQPGEAALREDLRVVLTAHVTPLLIGWYRALAPDFFTWLEES